MSKTFKSKAVNCQIKKTSKLAMVFITIMLTLFTNFVVIPTNNVYAADTDNSILEPSSDQYLELRATKVNKIEGKNKQVIMELWGYNIEFKGIDFRFEFDNSIYNPSNLETNEITDDETEYFKMEDEFKDSLELMSVPYAKAENVLREVVSFNPPVSTSEHIIEKDNVGKVVTTAGGVKLGEFSFNMNADKFDVSSFKLVEDESSPTTGIKINIDGTNSYQSQSVFKFTDDSASKDATLSNLQASAEITDETGTTTTKDYNLTPTFDKTADTQNYEVTLSEYLDTMKITATQNDAKASMKIKVPKRDDDGNLVYESDGTTISYEEKDLTDKTPYELTLNKLGETDTIVTVIVTAEDKETVKEYTVTIKRPYATIKGNIYLSAMSKKGIYKSSIKIFKSEDVAKVVDWSNTKVKSNGDKVHENLLKVDYKEFQTNDDGTYEIKIIPGTYDILFDKPGYLDKVEASKTVNEGDTLDLGQKGLLFGDVNKDGIVQLKDISQICNLYGLSSTDKNYDIKMDANEDGTIQLKDFSEMQSNYSKCREVE